MKKELQIIRLRNYLSERFGASEVNSYIWYDNTFNSKMEIETNGQVKVLNPQAQDSNTLRDSMVPECWALLKRMKRLMMIFHCLKLEVFSKLHTKG